MAYRHESHCSVWFLFLYMWINDIICICQTRYESSSCNLSKCPSQQLHRAWKIMDEGCELGSGTLQKYSDNYKKTNENNMWGRQHWGRGRQVFVPTGICSPCQLASLPPSHPRPLPVPYRAHSTHCSPPEHQFTVNIFPTTVCVCTHKILPCNIPICYVTLSCSAYFLAS